MYKQKRRNARQTAHSRHSIVHSTTRMPFQTGVRAARTRVWEGVSRWARGEGKERRRVGRQGNFFIHQAPAVICGDKLTGLAMAAMVPHPLPPHHASGHSSDPLACTPSPLELALPNDVGASHFSCVPLQQFESVVSSECSVSIVWRVTRGLQEHAARPCPRAHVQSKRPAPPIFAHHNTSDLTHDHVRHLEVSVFDASNISSLQFTLTPQLHT